MERDDLFGLFTIALFISSILLVLKLIGSTTCTWLAVAAPVLIFLCFIILIGISVGILALASIIWEDWIKK